MKKILSLNFFDNNIGIAFEYEFDVNYFKNKDLAVNIIKSTIDHFKKEMIRNGLASYEATPEKLN